jgi:hypothetical protein
MLGPGRRRDWYVRDAGGEFGELLHTSFSGEAGDVERWPAAKQPIRCA